MINQIKNLLIYNQNVSFPTKVTCDNLHPYNNSSINYSSFNIHSFLIFLAKHKNSFKMTFTILNRDDESSPFWLLDACGICNQNAKWGNERWWMGRMFDGSFIENQMKKMNPFFRFHPIFTKNGKKNFSFLNFF